MYSVKINGNTEGPMEKADAEALFRKTHHAAELFEISEGHPKLVKAKRAAHSQNFSLGDIAHGDIDKLLQLRANIPPKVHSETVTEILKHNKRKGKLKGKQMMREPK
jgi:hypothetical protein